MYRGMNRFRGSGSPVYRYLTLPQMRRKVSNSWSAMQDTYFSTKDIFERHKVVFTIATSIASIATAWIGYTLRHLHETRVDQRLERIESAMKNKYEIGDPEFKKLVSNSVSIPACVATAGTMLFIGFVNSLILACCLYHFCLDAFSVLWDNATLEGYYIH